MSAALDFNLLVSTARNFEEQVECEIWFNLITLGDETPLFFSSGYPGLIFVKTYLPPRELITHLNGILTNHDSEYAQFIQKIIPIDIVVTTDIPTIVNAALSLVKIHPSTQDLTSPYRITVKARNTLITPDQLISPIATILSYPVSLKQFKWNLQIEILGTITGIAILQPQDLFTPLRRTIRSIPMEN